MINILVPTDLSVSSLNIVHDIVKKHPKQSIRVFLVHMLHTPTDIMDLMFLKSYRQQQQVPDQFRKAMHAFSQTYSGQIVSIGLEFYFGSSAAILQGIAESRKIDAIYMLDKFTYSLPLKDSVNMVPLIGRCKVPVYKIQASGKVIIRSGEVKQFATQFFEKDYSTAM